MTFAHSADTNVQSSSRDRASGGQAVSPAPAVGPAAAAAVLPPDTALGHVHLTVADLDRSLRFYQDVLGMQVHRREGREAALGAGGTDLVRLVELPGARHVERTSGLYHYCVLVPSRRELGQLLRRIGETGAPVQGLVDHHVSEAIYLPDPDGNGVELNADRPREQFAALWQVAARRGNGPLDVDGLLAEAAAAPQPWQGLPPDATIGHVHLHVADVAAAERFYVGVLGFEKTMAFGDQAVFVAAGGYHHHVAFNIWAGRGAPPPPPDAAGLRHFTVRLPDPPSLDSVLARIHTAGLAAEATPEGPLVRDPSQNGVLLTASSDH